MRGIRARARRRLRKFRHNAVAERGAKHASVGRRPATRCVAVYTLWEYSMQGLRVLLARDVDRDLVRVPKHIVVKLRLWIRSVLTDGLEATRRRPGLHDEPLQGRRFGQRSIRLSRSWRAIYQEIRDEQGTTIVIREVTHHRY